MIAYHLRQSFKPGGITPELANKICYDLAMSLTKAKHAFIICTHVDKEHIHSHIVFNSTALDCTRKFNNFWGSSENRKRTIEYREEGRTLEETRRVFKVAISTIRTWEKQWKEKGSLTPALVV